MIIDTSAYPVTKERSFYGLKKNGKFYFNDSNNQPTCCYSLEVDHSIGRIEGESYFIKLTSNNSQFHGRELILGISKNDGEEHYTEIYNLNNKNFTKYLNEDMLGNIINKDIFIDIKL